jgi:FkbM family methyltransferase
VRFSQIVKHSLQRSLPASTLGFLATHLARSQGKGVRKIFPDAGLWVHETEFGYFAYQQPYIRLDLRQLDEIARRNFFWRYTPKNGDVVIDVGAGVGEEAMTFSRAVGADGKLVCIEAHPMTYACLEALIRYNQLRNVIAIHCAVTDSSRAHAVIEDSVDYLANRVGHSSGIKVPAATLDDICNSLRLGRVNFLKMNIEGAERFAIRGMTETLKRTDVLCICCHDFLANKGGDESCRTKSLVRDFLRQNGFGLVDRSETGCPNYIEDQVWAYNPAFTSAWAS